MPWNELEFVPWSQFHRMAPSILRLEISRLGDLIRSAGSDLEMRNALVRVRYELLEFLVAVERCEDGKISESATERLDLAIVHLPLDRATEDAKMHASLKYILDRLRSVKRRINFIYV